jgi:hypothetical protein
MTVQDDFKALKRVIGGRFASELENDLQVALENLDDVNIRKEVLQYLILSVITRYVRSMVVKVQIPLNLKDPADLL